MATIGTKLIRMRKNKGYSQQYVATSLHVSQAAYSKWESDQIRPSIDHLILLSKVFDVPLSELLDDAATPISNNTFTSCTLHAIGTVYNPTFNITSSELLHQLLITQKQIADMLSHQKTLIELLIKTGK